MSALLKERQDKIDSIEKKKGVNLPLSSKAFHKTSIIVRNTLISKSDLFGENIGLLKTNTNGEAFIQDKGIRNKLIATAQKSKDIVKLKDTGKNKHDSNMVTTEKRHSSDSISSEDYSNGEEDHPKEVGYSEVLENGNLEQMKARNVLNALKKRLDSEKQKTQGGKPASYLPSLGKPSGSNENQNSSSANLNGDKLLKQNAENVNNENQNFQISNYINTLRQNSNLSSDTYIKQVTLGPDNKVIHIKTPDYFTFMRLEHEINEVIRKQNEFHELKKNYFEKKLKQKEMLYDNENNKGYDQERIKKSKDEYDKEYLKGINLAEKYVQKTKKKNNVSAFQIAGKFLEGKKNMTRRQGVVTNLN